MSLFGAISRFADLDNDYDYIMSRALKSYRQHREKEKADTRKGPVKSSYFRRHHLRPKTAPPVRFVESIKVRNLGSSIPQATKVFVPKVDEIREVSNANPGTAEETDRYMYTHFRQWNINLVLVAIDEHVNWS